MTKGNSIKIHKQGGNKNEIYDFGEKHLCHMVLSGKGLICTISDTPILILVLVIGLILTQIGGLGI